MAIHSSIRSVHGISRRALGLSLAALTLVGASSAFVAPQAGLPQESAPKDTFALRADFVHIGDGTSLEGGYVTIENGKITGVAAQAADGVRVVDVGGHLSPGLIAVRDATGAGSEATESARKLTPTADVARAFDPTHPDWVKVLDEGITTVVLTPGSSRIAGGTAAIVSPATGAVVSRGALVSLGMSSRSLSFSVEPTSYAGLYSHLSDAFENAVEGSPLAAAKAGRVPVLMEAVSRLEVLNAIEFAQGQGLKGAIIGAPRASDTVDEIKDAGLSVVFEPIKVGDQPFAATSAVALEKAGVSFAFTADANSVGPASMRMTAAAFMRAGVSRKTALMAMTKNAADLLGAGATHGTIAAGKVADLVVWSGDPTDLTSRVLHVYGGGELVRDLTEEDAQTSGAQTMILSSFILAGTLALAPQASPAQADAKASTSWSVHAEKLYTGTGTVHENALVVVTDGKITAITPGIEATRDSLRASVMTAGMIDPSGRLNTGRSSVEQSREVTPSVEARFGIDPFDPRWARLAKSGVTTTFVTPLNQNCIGGLGAIVKTAGGTFEERMVDGADLIGGAIGSQPSQGNSPAFGRPTSFFNRRPTTRMGVEWEWRKWLFDAGQAPSEGNSDDIEILQDVLAGKIGVFVQAYTTQDIRTAIFLKEEMQREGFGSMRVVIDCGAEAWREPDMLTRTETAVVLPPLPSQGRTTDGALMPLDTAKKLLDQEIQFALSAHSAGNPAERLDVQAGFAMRGGLTREEALRAVTSAPAEILGIAERVGTVEVGKDADLVLWNGEPFEITSKPVGVLVGGNLALDPR